MTPVAGASAALAADLVPAMAGVDRDVGWAALVERPIEVDQTNVSVVVAETVIVKWLDPPVPAPHPGVELLAHLREVGFDEMPGFHGVAEDDGVVVALVSEFVPGALDGWDWFVDELTGWFDGDVAAGAISSSADRLGRLAARLHVAFATPSSVLPDPVASAPVTGEALRSRRLLAEACELAVGDARELVAALRDDIESVVGELDAVDATPVQRIHGDLHVGQVLRSPARPDRLVVTDFDGNPIADADTRRQLRPAAADLASLVQSVDHAGRVAIRRRADAAIALAPVITAAVDTTLDAYRDELSASGSSDLLDVRLVRPFRVAQELHELVYAARHLPRWTYAPVATLTAMFA